MTLFLVIPCYNEQEVLHETSRQLKEKMNYLISAGKISYKSRIVFVDDGSKDKTWEIIEELHESDCIFRGVKLSRNRGHQNALLAGLMTVKNECDAAISLDADLQDDIDAIDGMVDKFSNEKCDVVYGVRSARKTDTFFKKFTAESFYKIMAKMGVEVTFNHADYRLMSRRALAVKPIRMITTLGVGIFTVSIIMLVYFLVRHFMGDTVEGWTSIVVSVWAIGGLQLLAIGIIGEYIGKIYLETKERPKFIIDKYLGD